MRNSFDLYKEVVEDAISRIELSGHDIIEVKWTKDRTKRKGSIAKLLGFKIPIGGGANNTNQTNINEASLGLTTGYVKFYPDKYGLNYGYIVDVMENRIKLAKLLRSGWVQITDRQIKSEIEELAKQEKLPISPETDEYSKKGEKLFVRDEKVIALEAQYKKEKEELERKIREMTEYINKEKTNDDSKAKEEKPLAGKKISRGRPKNADK